MPGDAKKVPVGLELATSPTEVDSAGKAGQTCATGGLIGLGGGQADPGRSAEVGGHEQLDGPVVRIGKEQNPPAGGNLRGPGLQVLHGPVESDSPYRSSPKASADQTRMPVTRVLKTIWPLTMPWTSALNCRLRTVQI